MHLPVGFPKSISLSPKLPDLGLPMVWVKTKLDMESVTLDLDNRSIPFPWPY